MTNGLVLIIDDNKVNLKLINLLVQLSGHETILATNTEEALECLSKAHPSLILMDIQLPGIDGLELTRRLKADERFKHIPVIAITAYAMKGDRERVVAAGCDEYLTKPLDTAVFEATLAKYLSNQGLESSQRVESATHN